MDVREISHARLDVLLKKYVDENGGVDYKRWKASPEDVLALEKYISTLANASPDSKPELFKNETDKLIYWINIYNAIVIRGVLEHYPIDSVIDVKPTALSYVIKGKGFFYDYRYVIGGKEMNLKDVEDEILRKQFMDPRIHFAINCASGSCPPMRKQAFGAEDAQSRLDEASSNFINDTKNVRVDLDERKVYLSAIFDWYKDDFINYIRKNFPRNDPSVLDFIIIYARAQQLQGLKTAREKNFELTILDYDWSLNGK